MTKQVLTVWAVFRWALILFLFAQVLEAPLVAHFSEPVKPLRVWTGVASWYGSEFQGRQTASGEPYDINAATAASPTLPLGSIVRVVNPKTGKSQVVRINDRGPFVEGRDLDVSYEVAQRLGIAVRGLVRLRFELLEVPPRRATQP